MPCGLGFHPYFPCSTGTLLQTAVSHVWTIDENVLPVERVAATGRYALDGGTVCGRGLDNGYDGWSGLALISQPDAPFDLCMSSRSEERRVGKECVSTCRSRWSP